jgi:hypothetical protein
MLIGRIRLIVSFKNLRCRIEIRGTRSDTNTIMSDLNLARPFLIELSIDHDSPSRCHFSKEPLMN